MAFYASTVLKQNLGEVLLSADQKPVIVTRYNKNRYIIMSVEFYKSHIAKPSNTTSMPSKETILEEKYPGLSEALASFQALENKQEPKAALNMRIDKDVLDFFKSTGRGYQANINAVLRAFKDAHSGLKGD